MDLHCLHKIFIFLYTWIESLDFDEVCASSAKIASRR